MHSNSPADPDGQLFEPLNKENQELLQSVFDTSLIGIAVLKAVRDKKGVIQDFEIRFINKVLETETGRTDLIGKLYAKIFPGVKKMGLFLLMSKVVETGNPEQIKYAYHYDGIDKWFHSMFVKLDDGLISSNQDITGRKKAELEKQKNLVLLQQAEEIIRMGSWDYNLRTGEFLWSAGMYRLFGLAKEKKVSPEIYLEYATKNCLPAAGRIVNSIKTGKPDFEETLEIMVAKKVKIIKVKAALLTYAVDASERVIGVDLDVTVQEENIQLEGRYKAMEADQNRKIFQATLNSQEEERKRIAESLHNSLGQLLYGVKLSLDQLDFDKAKLDIEWLKEAKKRTSHLLTESIKESRRISHEMTPTILEDFGLKYAVNDICNQFKQDIKITCHFTGTRKLNKYLEIAIYRIVQELIINIFKHAQGTEAAVSIVIHKKTVSLIVQDNGVGFSDLGTGIGLKTIRNKVRLLNGKFNLSWGSGENTIVNISFPYEQDL